MDKNRILSGLAKIAKLLNKGVALSLVAITILSFLFVLYGREETFQNISNFLNMVFSTRSFLQITFLAILVIVIITAFFCIKGVYRIRKDISQDYEKNSSSLKRITTLLSREQELGILAIKLRDQYNNDLYKNIYRNTMKELTISGHSLNKTINIQKRDDLRSEFRNAIIRVIKKDLPVKILLLKPSALNGLSEKRKVFSDFVSETYNVLLDEKIDNVTIARNFLIKETDFLPYYIVKNESILHIAHYTFGEYTDTKKNMYIFEASADFGYGKYCYDDFDSFFDNSAEFIMQYRKLFNGQHNE